MATNSSNQATNQQVSGRKPGKTMMWVVIAVVAIILVVVFAFKGFGTLGAAPADVAAPIDQKIETNSIPAGQAGPTDSNGINNMGTNENAEPANKDASKPILEPGQTK